MFSEKILNFRTHVRTGKNALMCIVIDDNNYVFDLVPTINWVPSSSSMGSHEVPVKVMLFEKEKRIVKVKINVEGGDVLICGYEMLGANFVISSQPKWNVPEWQPYDITGHQGSNAEYQGNGSLQIMSGQSVDFEAMIFG